MIYDRDIILKVLKDFTGIKFHYDLDNDLFESKHFDIEETSNYFFTLYSVSQDYNTGVIDHFLKCENETLAGICEYILKLT